MSVCWSMIFGLSVCKRGVKLHFHAPIRALLILQIIILRLLFSSCPIHIFIVIIIIIIKMTTNNMAVNTSHSFSLLPIVFTFWPIIFRCVAFLLIGLFSIIKFTMVFIINHHWHISLLKCMKYYINKEKSMIGLMKPITSFSLLCFIFVCCWWMPQFIILSCAHVRH